MTSGKMPTEHERNARETRPMKYYMYLVGYFIEHDRQREARLPSFPWFYDIL